MAESSCTNGFHVDEDGEMSSYKKHALSVVNFKIIYSKDDLQSNRPIHFKPEMAHQVFGESENIFGYRSLSITLHYLHNSSRCYLDIEKTVGVKNNDPCKPDDIMKSLNPWLPENFTTDIAEYLKMIENEKHDLMFGTVLHEFKDKKECKLFPNENIFADYKITFCDINEEFKEFHRRFETFIVWFIDAASFIDLDDVRWMIFYVYEEFQHPETKETYRSPVGFCSTYKFYAYPSNVRMRISQFFILPSHQKRGIGSKLYQTVVRKIRDMPEAVDITVEEPTTTFQKIRDFDDCVTVHKALEEAKINIASGSQKKIFELMRKQKICKRQCQRVYDILGCYNASRSGLSEYQKHKNSIKQRITTDFEKETRSSKRLCNLERAGICMDPTDRAALSEAEFKKYMDDIEPSVTYVQLHFPDSQ